MRSQDDLSRVLALLWSFVPYQSVRAASSSGLFKALDAAGGLDVGELARQLGWKTRPTKRIVEILESFSLLRVDADRVSLTEFGATWFLPDSPSYIGGYFEQTVLLEAAYRDLENNLRSDAPNADLFEATQRAFGLSPEATRNDVAGFGQVLSATSGPVAAAFFEKVDVPPDAAVLDVGTGLGIFVEKLIDRSHHGRIDVLDTPLVCEEARETLGERAGEVSWIETGWGDWQPSARYDFIFMHHVMHEEPAEQAIALLEKCAGALNDRGTLSVIGLFELDDDANPLARYFGLNILLEIGGDNTSLDTVRTVAPQLGLKEERTFSLPGGRSAWVAVKD